MTKHFIVHWGVSAFVVYFFGGGVAAQEIVITEIDTGKSQATEPASAANIPRSDIPAGLFDQDPMVRLMAVQKVENERNLQAETKLASMVQSDPFPEVRQAACRALSTLGAVSQIGVLQTVAASDLNTLVRNAAADAVKSLQNRPKYATKADILAADSQSSAEEKSPGESASDRDKYRKPELKVEGENLKTRTFAFGFGTMGGYGLAAIDARFRISTPAEWLPWVGIEVGGGWTPPSFYPIIAGPVGEVTNEDNKWKIISAAAAVLIYVHRLHYIPLRGGFDIGQGPYAMLGYGFEQLNQEGFFSWGVEAGILIHPVIGDRRDNLVDCENSDNQCSDDDLWPVIPYVRFSLHFYLV